MNEVSESDAAHRVTTVLTSVLLLSALWSLTHQYEGLGGDAELYAFQALAKIRPNLAHDLFLANNSQADYTIFSSLYSRCIAFFGLHGAARILTIVLKAWFLSAAWLLSRVFMNRDTALLAIALLIVVPGSYGAFDVFRFSEDWLTARTLAEALVATAFWMYFRSFKAMSAFIILLSLLVHPLMALPGALILLGLWAPMRVSTGFALGGVIGAFCIGLAAPSSNYRLFALMDPHWLEIVRERSQFLFLDLWRPRDWMLNARPLLALTLSASVLRNPRIQKLCAVSILVGITGLGIALVGSLSSPMAILLQGQSWRWIWPSVFLAILLAVPTARKMWRNETCGALSALLIILAWILSSIVGVVCLAAASALWLMRDRFSSRTAIWLRWIALAIAVAVIAWALESLSLNSRSSVATLPGQPNAVLMLRRIFSIGSLAALFGFLTWYGLIWRRGWQYFAIGTCLLTISAFMLPNSFVTFETEGTPAEMADLLEWRNLIPLNSNVLVLPIRNSARFQWFTLQRPSYLSLNQSSGVVFSAETALEVERRSEVLLPVSDPDWRLLSSMRNAHGVASAPAASRPISRQGLLNICADRRLNFVVAKEDIGFDRLRSSLGGKWKDWNLYDCRRVLATASSS